MEKGEPGRAIACSRQGSDESHGRKEGPKDHSGGRVAWNHQDLIRNQLGLEEGGGPGWV